MNKFITQCFLYGSILLLLTVSIAAETVETPKKVQDETFNKKAKVDRRVELFTIVARLAGFEEYSNKTIKRYSDDIDRHFEKYKQHSAITFLKELRKDHGVAYDAVMTMAVHLSQPPELKPRIPFQEAFKDGALDGRWGNIEKAEKFVKLLRQFYKDADCEGFFESQKDFYATVEKRFQPVLDKVDFDWYHRYYGELPNGTSYVYIVLDSRGNYGPEVVFSEKKKDIYAIITTRRVDNDGLPVYGESHLATLIHEFCHSFVNPLFFANKEKFKPAGEKVFASVRNRVRLIGYGNWESIVIESLVRASVIRYILEHEANNPKAAYNRLITERNRGFIWIEELVSLLGAYENSRKSFSTFRSLFPLVIGYFDELSKHIDRKAKTFEQMSPHVMSMSPFANEAQDVDPNITQLTINFDKPLDTEIAVNPRSIRQGKGGKSSYPIVKVIGFNETGTSLKIEVKLKPDWEYEFVLNGLWFRTKDGAYPLQNYTMKFKTRK